MLDAHDGEFGSDHRFKGLLLCAAKALTRLRCRTN
jgi:hypothetical protein